MAKPQGGAPSPLTSDRVLVRRMATGDRTALRELRLRYGTTAYAVAYTVVVDPELAEEAVSRAFALAWGRAKELPAGGDGVAAWISQLTREVAGRLRQPA